MQHTDTLIFHEILSIQDPSWDSWQAIYYDSFPKNERMTERFFLRLLKKKAAKRARDDHLWAISHKDEPGLVLAIAYFQTLRKLKIGYLWYIAIRQGHRGQGLGADIYAAILSQVKPEGFKLAIFEVEKPEQVATRGAAARDLAERRIQWYRRQGAKLLGGVRFFQKVDAPVAPIEMRVMAHLFAEMTPKEVFKIAAKLFKKDLLKIGSLSLT